MTACHPSIFSEGRISNWNERKASPCQIFPLPHFLVLVENLLWFITLSTNFCGIFWTIEVSRYVVSIADDSMVDGRHHANAIIIHFLWQILILFFYTFLTVLMVKNFNHRVSKNLFSTYCENLCARKQHLCLFRAIEITEAVRVAFLN